jgi:hypothetical protein
MSARCSGAFLSCIPFFYWYQFLWVILSAILTETAYAAMRRRQAK